MSNKVCVIAEAGVNHNAYFELASASEMKNITIARRSIVAKVPIYQGQPFSDDNIICKRPAGGVNPMQWPNLIGKIADRNYAMDDLIHWPNK